ncbi:MAG TPA: MCP four helix bundle domain-containing protein, partial [Bryobacteraceae bacterium]
MRFLSNMRLGKKIGLSSGAMVAVLLGTVALSLAVMARIRTASDHVREQEQRTSQTQMVQAHVVRTVMRMGNLMVHEQRHSLEERRETGRCGFCHAPAELGTLTGPILQETEEYEKQLSELAASAATADERKLLQAISNSSTAVKSVNNRLIGLWTNGKFEDAWNLYCTDSRPAVAKMDDAIARLVDYRRAQVQNIENASAATISLVRWLLLLAGLGAAAAALPMAVLMARDVSRPIVRIIEHCGELARGDVSRDIPQDLLDRKDEAGDLSRATQQVITELRPMIR